MAAIITIPIDAHLITLCIESFEVVSRTIQVGRSTQTQRERVRSVREVGPRLDATGLDHAISTVNQVWTPADIVFNLRSTDFPRVNAPGNNEEVNEAGFFQLASQFPARRGVSALFVSRFASRDLGGQAAEALGCCIVAFHGEQLTGKTLAHELGHLLSLGHVARDSPNSHFNLMYEALRADDRLTADQIRAARGSGLVARAYQQQASP